MSWTFSDTHVGQTIKTWSVMETLLSVVGLVFILLCSLLF